MTVLRHAQLELWNRDERGDYRAALAGAELVVWWLPVTARGRGQFMWEVKMPSGTRIMAEHPYEEPEVAMAAAEDVAAPIELG